MASKSPWDEDERADIIAEMQLDTSAIIDFNKKETEIREGLCFGLANACNPWRWTDLEASYGAIHVALSRTHVMYLSEKYPVHALNPCPPCMCCVAANYKEDFAPKTRKTIPFEKITDIEVSEAGANRLIQPGCMCPPQFNPISLEIPFSSSAVNTAGNHGVELVIQGIKDPKGFRKQVMDMKNKGNGGGTGVSALSALAPAQEVMGAPGNASEMTRLLQDIANSQREANDIHRQILRAVQKEVPDPMQACKREH